MLPHLAPSARIFTCDWPAGLFDSADTVQSTIKELARKLLLAIQSRPGADETRPILFIASCLGGGIVLVQALCIAAQPGNEYASLWRATGAVVFLATPFRGTAFNDVARLAVGFAKLYARVVDKQVTQLLDSVGDSTSFLQELVASFTLAYFQQGHACQLAIFYETEKSNLLRKVLPLRYLADILKRPKLVLIIPLVLPYRLPGLEYLTLY